MCEFTEKCNVNAIGGNSSDFYMTGQLLKRFKFLEHQHALFKIYSCDLVKVPTDFVASRSSILKKLDGQQTNQIHIEILEIVSSALNIIQKRKILNIFDLKLEQFPITLNKAIVLENTNIYGRHTILLLRNTTRSIYSCESSTRFHCKQRFIKGLLFPIKDYFSILKIHHRGNGITSHFEMMFHQCLKRFYRNIVYRYMIYTARSTDFSFSLSINLLTDDLGIPIKDPYYYN